MRQLELIPPLPKLSALAREIRRLWLAHSLVPEPVWVALCLEDGGWAVRLLAKRDERSPYFGAEHIPGDAERFDAVAAARRLLFAAEDAGYSSLPPAR